MTRLPEPPPKPVSSPMKTRFDCEMKADSDSIAGQANIQGEDMVQPDNQIDHAVGSVTENGKQFHQELV